MIKFVATFIGGIIFCAILGTTTFFLWSTQKMTYIHKLKHPLLLSGDEKTNTLSLLPIGTTLYFEKSYPEGFTSYKVYINVDRNPLKIELLKDPTTIIPIDAYVPDKNDLEKLLSDYPLTKKDLEAILRSGKISKDEIRDVFTNFLR